MIAVLCGGGLPGERVVLSCRVDRFTLCYYPYHLLMYMGNLYRLYYMESFELKQNGGRCRVGESNRFQLDHCKFDCLHRRCIH